MRPDQWDRVQSLLAQALEIPEADRLGFVDRECTDDAEVRDEVRSLLGYAAGDVLSSTLVESAMNPPQPAELPESIRGYRVVRKLGEGGMGVVVEAEQSQPVRRTVAIKLIKMGMDTHQVVNRFQAERQALALMSHPYIARVFEAGATEDGRPYFVMELVEGESILQFCDDHNLSTSERLRLFVQICEGIQHAHQKGIIHRDIKPSNILVSKEQGDAVPKIIDFGIAKATERHATEATLLTEVGQVVGTLAYMSPEQAHLSGHDIDTRTDVYSLGVLLYELLVGALPFETTDGSVPFDEICRRIREEDPPRPSTRFRSLEHASSEIAGRRRTDPGTFARDLRGDLDWIVMRALEKDRSRRYASVSEFAADVERYLSHEPVAARPPGSIYRMRKFVRRHRVGVGFAALLVLVLLGGIVATSIARVRAVRAEREAVALVEYLVDVFKVPKEGRARGESVTALEMLDAKSTEIREELEGEPGARGRLMAAMAEAYRGLGEYQKSAMLLDDALPLLRTAYGERSKDVFSALNEQGNTAIQLKNDEDAKRYFEQALPIAESLNGPDHQHVATIAKNLADALVRLEQYEAARGYLERAIRIRKQVYGEADMQVARAMSSLATVLGELGDHDAAIEMAGESLEIRRANYEPNARGLGFGFYFLAGVQMKAGDYQGAVDNYESTLQIWTAALGPDHGDVGTCWFNVAKAQAKLGETDEAYGSYLRARDIIEQVYNPDDARSATGLARSYDEYAEFLEEIGRTDEASELREAALWLQKQPESEP